MRERVTSAGAPLATQRIIAGLAKLARAAPAPLPGNNRLGKFACGPGTVC